jgi:hypothetical protein
MDKRAATALLSLTLMLACFDTVAHKLSFSECKEGSDFIKNAALSRENGMSRRQFIDRLLQDTEAIRAFPPSLRWFMQDEDDEHFLLHAADEVFDNPRPPEAHRREFFAVCLARSDAREL